MLYHGNGNVIDVSSGYSEKTTMAAWDEGKFEIDFFGIKAAEHFELFASGVANKHKQACTWPIKSCIC